MLSVISVTLPPLKANDSYADGGKSVIAAARV